MTYKHKTKTVSGHTFRLFNNKQTFTKQTNIVLQVRENVMNLFCSLMFSQTTTFKNEK